MEDDISFYVNSDSQETLLIAEVVLGSNFLLSAGPNKILKNVRINYMIFFSRWSTPILNRSSSLSPLKCAALVST